MFITEPMVRAAIQEKHFTFMRFALTAFVVFAGFTNGSTQTLFSKPTADGFITDVNTVFFFQRLGEMGKVVAFVRIFIQINDLFTYLQGFGMNRLPCTIPAAPFCSTHRRRR